MVSFVVFQFCFGLRMWWYEDFGEQNLVAKRAKIYSHIFVDMVSLI
jgi:hypothetical protein